MSDVSLLQQIEDRLSPGACFEENDGELLRAAGAQIERLRAMLEVEQKRANPLLTKCETCGKLQFVQQSDCR